jgi:hypothetical protein
MKKTYAPHVTALLSGIGAVMSVVHPGFTIPVGVQGLVASLCVVAATFTEALHFVKHHSLQSNIALATHLASQMGTVVQTETTKTE